MICKAVYVNAIGRLIERTFPWTDDDGDINYIDNFVSSSVSKFMFSFYADNGEFMESVSRGFSI